MPGRKLWEASRRSPAVVPWTWSSGWLATPSSSLGEEL